MTAIWMALVLGGMLASPAEVLTGWVSDENCGALHTTPGREDCVEKCIKGAPHLNPEWVPQRMVFVTDGDEAIWFVENPEALKGEEGRHLRIEAVTSDADDDDGTEGKSLRVLSKVRIGESED